MTTLGGNSPQPLHGKNLVVGTLALSLAVFMIILDSSIANVAIQTISGDLGVSPQQGTWVITSFAVSNAVTIPLTGWLTARIGQVRLFVGSILLFVASSLFCGLAPNIETLILARLLQGAAAGPIIPLSQALLLPSYPPAKIGMALSFWGTTTLVAPISGPLLGGWIAQTYAWPWMFFINVPIGLVSAWAAWVIYRDRESPTEHSPMDKVGFILLVLWVGALQLMLDKGRELDWFNSAVIVALAAVALVGFAAFVIWEWFDSHAIVNLALFKDRNFCSGVATLAGAYGLFFANLVILPFWLQTHNDYTPLEAGKVMAPVGILAILLTPLVGKLLGTVNARWLATFGLLVFALVFHLRARFTPDVDSFTVMLPTLIQGAAMAFFFTPLNSIILSGLRSREIPSAAGVFIFARTMFGGVCTSIILTLWDRRVVLHHAHLTEYTHAMNMPFNQMVQDLVRQGFSEAQAFAMIERTITVQAGTLGATDVFHISSVLFVLLIGLVWVAKPIQLRIH